MLLRGRVVSGLGNFSYWIEKLEDHYFRKTGMHFYPGTLNLLLDGPGLCRRAACDSKRKSTAEASQ